MTNDVKIEAGQVWVTGFFEKEVKILYSDSRGVFFEWAEDQRREVSHPIFFLAKFRLKLPPQTRPVAWEDVRELLAKYGVIYNRRAGDKLEEVGDWEIVFKPIYAQESQISEWQFSPNPWAVNPVIIGPMVEVR